MFPNERWLDRVEDVAEDEGVDLGKDNPDLVDGNIEKLGDRG